MATRESFEAQKFSSGEKTPIPHKSGKKKFVYAFQAILSVFSLSFYVFLGRNLTDPDPLPKWKIPLFFF